MSDGFLEAAICTVQKMCEAHERFVRALSTKRFFTKLERKEHYKRLKSSQ